MVLKLPTAIGPKGDVDSLHRLTGDGGLAAALAALPPLVEEELAMDDEGEEADPLRGGAIWPQLDEAAYHGLAGEVAREIAPQTEADPAALLVTFLIFVGNAAGRTVHSLVSGTPHTPNEYVAIVGNTGTGRKGSSMGYIKQLAERAPGLRSGFSQERGLDRRDHHAFNQRPKVGDPLLCGPIQWRTAPGFLRKARYRWLTDGP